MVTDEPWAGSWDRVDPSGVPLDEGGWGWDDGQWEAWWMEPLAGKPAAVLCEMRRAARLVGEGWRLCGWRTGRPWRTDEPGPSRVWHPVVVRGALAGAGGTDMFEATSVIAGRVRRYQRPVAVMKWLVEMVCPAGGLVVDPFAGTGSTGVACVETGRRFVGIEMDAELCGIANERLKVAKEALDG